MRGWRPALRIAWRDVVRSRGRALLVLVMVALPVLAVTAATVVMATSDVSGAEGVDRRLGNADALVSFPPDATSVVQTADPDSGATGISTEPGAEKGPRDLAAISRVLGREVPGISLRTGSTAVQTSKGLATPEAFEVDLRDPLADGLFTLEEGSPPRTGDEVAINPELADRGFAVGDTIEVGDGSRRTVSAIVVSTSYTGHPMIVGPPGSLELPGDEGSVNWLIGGGDVSWAEVRELNGIAALVTSRAVLLDPPPASELPADLRMSGSGDDAMMAVLALVATMVLLEVVLLAGPAFAVGARKQARTLALVAACGGTPAQARRVILAGGLVLGALAAGIGVALGILLGAALVPVVQTWSDSVFGPFEVRWDLVALVALFGVAASFLAAVVPAVLASRQDVVAVLAGRRGDRAPSRRSPVLGVLLLGLGIGGAAYGAVQPMNGEFFISAAAIVAVLGMVLLVPVALVAAAQVARWLPLSGRFALRDAVRHRTRTVPAVAAVAATVAGVVAVAIATTSDEAEARATYQQLMPMGEAHASVNGDFDALADVRAAVERELPDAKVDEIVGVPSYYGEGSVANTWVEAWVAGDASPMEGGRPLLDMYGSNYGTSVLVGSTVPEVAGLPADQREAADAALARGGVVAFTDRELTASRVVVQATTADEDGMEGTPREQELPGYLARLEPGRSHFQLVASPAAAKALGLDVRPVGLRVHGTEISRDEEADAAEAVRAVTSQGYFSVERGYTTPDEDLIVMMVLVALGGVLMLGGTLTATFLALSDARPDLATLSAVGASPGSRRRIGAAYALVVGFLGALLGAAVGFIPGIAVTYPLTSRSWDPTGAGPGHYLDVPWLPILAIVVALPLVTALAVALCVRSRLPLVARLD
jgi:putative ABC transport system permease protein